MTTNEILMDLSNNSPAILKGINLISFGSNNKDGDYDFFAYKNSHILSIKPDEIIADINKILSLFKVSLPFKYQIFPFNLHRNFIAHDKKIHLLFYPNQISFVYNEFPSLLGHISKNGCVVFGKNLPIKYFEIYKKRAPLGFGMFEYHFFSYNNLVVNYLIYYLTNCAYIENKDIKEKVIFSIKLSLIEILNEFFRGRKELLPDWETIIKTQDFYFLNLSRINDIHKKIVVDKSDLEFLFSDYFKIYNYGISLSQSVK